MKEIKILIIDDEKTIRNEVADFLSNYRYKTLKAELPSEGYRILKEEEIDVVILDIRLPEEDGIHVLEKIKKERPNIEVIMITGHGDSETVIKAMELGAFDFFHKPIDGIEIKNAIERTNKFIQIAEELKRVKTNYSLISETLKQDIGDIIGKSAAIKDVVNLTLKAAKANDTSVLITGPSGSGKELIARVIHYASERKDSPFIPVNCSAIPEPLIESEFFGHVKGSFTGALDNKSGHFNAADSGTLFLDEIGDMPISVQPKILRALEEKKIKKVGSQKEENVDIRIVAATNQNVKTLIEKKTFREDLFYRLNTIEIHIPPLKERREDIKPLSEHYLEVFAKNINLKVKRLDKNALSILENYDFPGNIRELKNIIERAVILSNNNVIGAESLNFIKKEEKEKKNETENFNLDDAEKKLILKALQKTNDDKQEAAELLGISTYALRRKMTKYEIPLK